MVRNQGTGKTVLTQAPFRSKVLYLQLEGFILCENKCFVPCEGILRKALCGKLTFTGSPHKIPTIFTSVMLTRTHIEEWFC